MPHFSFVGASKSMVSVWQSALLIIGMDEPRLMPQRPTCYGALMEISERITIKPSVRSGKPCIRGTRITVSDVLEYLAGGMSEDEIIHDFPELTREDIRACLSFAAERGKRIVTLGVP